VPVLVAIARHHPTMKERTLEVLAGLPIDLSRDAAMPDDLVEAEIVSHDAARRVTGYRLAALAGWTADRIVPGLSDPDVLVRRAAVDALQGRAESIESLRTLLRSEDPRVRLAAIEALGQAEATDILFAYLRDEAFPRIAAYRGWRKSLPSADATWVQIARLAMAEADRAAIDEVLATLDALGHDQAVKYIRRFIGAGDERMRARAAEAISAFDERKLVTPLLPLLDEQSETRRKRLPLASVIAQMKKSSSPWLRRAAALAKPKEPAMSAAEEGLLDRLLFLRKVPIFESCTLDDLYAIHQVMTRADFADGDLIMEDGAQGEQLFVLLEGTARVGRRTPSGFVEYTTLSSGSTFGEMALFGDGIRTADVIAVGAVACLVLERSHFEDLIRQQPGILMQICRLFGSRLRAANRGSDALRAEVRS
jgi:Cyclic nucleotide-binding domain/HEAT repeats